MERDSDARIRRLDNVVATVRAVRIAAIFLWAALTSLHSWAYWIDGVAGEGEKAGVAATLAFLLWRAEERRP